MSQTTIDLIIFITWATITYAIISRPTKEKTKGRHAKR